MRQFMSKEGCKQCCKQGREQGHKVTDKRCAPVHQHHGAVVQGMYRVLIVATHLRVGLLHPPAPRCPLLRAATDH